MLTNWAPFLILACSLPRAIKVTITNAAMTNHTLSITFQLAESGLPSVHCLASLRKAGSFAPPTLEINDALQARRRQENTGETMQSLQEVTRRTVRVQKD